MRTILLSVALASVSMLSLAADTKSVPAGGEIVVRTNESIDSRTAQPGQTFSAVVDRDVTDITGAATIPKGSNATLVLERVSGGGVGSPELAVGLQSVTVNGRRYLVTAPSVEKGSGRGIGRNKRTAEMVGGGGALGAVIGAIAGGGKGAIIGAIAGAAAGGTAQVLTKGKEVHVPAETVLTYKMSQPVQLESH